jgi:predicted dehydrogenase
MDSIGVGVIGVGLMGDLFARLLAQSPRAELVGVTDLDPGRANSVAQTLGCAAYPTTERSPSRKRPNAPPARGERSRCKVRAT